MSESQLLLKTMRSDYVDMEFFGHLALFNKAGIVSFQPKPDEKGRARPFFLRSLAKPIQASILVDFDLRPPFALTSKQIAIACASHIGESAHTEAVLSILKQFNLSENSLQCQTHLPINPSGFTGTPKPVNNNCSGKHALMLALCSVKDWDAKSYLEFEHPLQQLIFKKHQELCECEELVVSYDSCGTPIFGMPLENIAKGYLNLFLDEKYNIIKKAFLTHPDLIGGEGRLDTKIMLNNPSLIAKVGAGGFLAVLNIESEEILLVKMAQDNNLPREIVASEALLQLGWLKSSKSSKNPVKPLQNKDITTYAGKKVAEYVAAFQPLR